MRYNNLIILLSISRLLVLFIVCDCIVFVILLAPLNCKVVHERVVV